MMERLTDSRRVSCSSNFNSSNGLASRRRSRFQTNDSDEDEHRVCMSQETKEVRDSRAQRKERERERLRRLLNSGKKRRRFCNSDITKPVKASSNGNSVTVEAYKTTGEGGQGETAPFGQSNSKALKFKKPFVSTPDQIISLSIPCKSRTAGIRRKGRIWRRIKVDSDVEIPAPSISTEAFNPGTHPSAQKSNIEAEIAEVLYGLKKRPCPSSRDPEPPVECPTRRRDSNSRNMGSEICVNKFSSNQQSVLPQGEAALLGCGPMHGEGEKILAKNEGKPLVSAEEAKTRTSLEKAKQIVETENNSKPLAGFPRTQSEDAKKEAGTTEEVITALEIKRKQPRKFVIDLMAPPPMELSPEDNEVERFGGEMGTATKCLMAGEFLKEEGINDTKNIPNMLVKCELADPTLERQVRTSSELDREFQKRDWLSSNSIVPKAQSSSSSMPLLLASEWSTHQCLASGKLVDSPLQPKRCGTHYHIARSIYSHQKAMQAKSFLPIMGNFPSFNGTTSISRHNMLKSETMVLGNPSQANSLAGSPISVKEETKDIKYCSQKYPVSHEMPQPDLAGYTIGGSCIFPPCQNHATAAIQSGNSKSIFPKDLPVLNNLVATMSPLMPGSASIMRSSYSNGAAPVLATLPSNKHPEPISNDMIGSSIGGENSVRMPLFKGQVQPSKVFFPVHIPQQWASHQSTHGTKDLNLPQWHLQRGSLLKYENKLPRQEQKHRVLAPVSSNISETRFLNFSVNQNPEQRLALFKSRLSSQSASEGALVIDCSSRTQNFMLPVLATQIKSTHSIPTTRTFQVSPIIKNQPSSLPTKCSKEFSVLSQNIFDKHRSPFPMQSRNSHMKSASQVFPSSASRPRTDHLSKQKPTSRSQQISFSRIRPAPKVAQQWSRHHNLQSRNSSSLLHGDCSLSSISRTKTTLSKMSSNNSTSMVVFSGGNSRPLIPTIQTKSILGGSAQKSSPVCGRNVPSILGRLPELKY